MAQVIAPLITESYRAQQEALHATGAYGTASIKHAGTVTKIINSAKITHLLDYGCGSLLNLYKHIKPEHKLTYQAYDPGVPQYSEAPVPAQMVACIDVLEHIEPEYLDNVLDDLVRVTEDLLYCTIHTGPAGKVLSDGRNAHLIQQPLEWWLPKLMSRFDVSSVGVEGVTICCVLYAKQRLESVNGGTL
jgi:hypothetical protein